MPTVPSPNGKECLVPFPLTRKSFLKFAAAFAASPRIASAKALRKWYKGNLHTHTLVSDGRAFPVESALLYRDVGYNFVMFSDHNLVHDAENWVTEKNHKRKRFSEADAKRFAEKYPAFRPETRTEPDGTTAWRYGTFEETAKAVDDPGRFLLMSGCEYNDSLKGGYSLHCNAINSFKAHRLKRFAKMRDSFDHMHASFRRLTAGEDALFMVNHPFYWFYDVDPLILADVDELRFFEIVNGDASVPFNRLPEGAYDCDKLWDFALAKRALRGAPPIFATGTDDTHYYGHLYKEAEGKRSTYGNHAIGACKFVVHKRLTKPFKLCKAFAFFPLWNDHDRGMQSNTCDLLCILRWNPIVRNNQHASFKMQNLACLCKCSALNGNVVAILRQIHV